MSRRVVSCLLLTVLLSSSISPRAASDPDEGCSARPANIDAGAFEPVVEELLSRSAVFRQQCGAVVRARAFIRIVISFVLGSGATRARATIQRAPDGSVRAEIELPPAADFAELLPHEFEHVLEQIEGLDLAAAARAGSGVQRLPDGSYETARARTAGQEAAREYYGETPAVLRTTVRHLRRALGAIAARAGGDGQAPRIRAGVHKDF